MNRTRKLLAIGATIAAFGGIGAVAAVAQTSTSAKPSVVTPAPTTDADKLQQGDQTTPDAPEALEVPDPNEKPDAPEATGSSGKAEAPGRETANDGPGGHEDPPGNVDHQFDGEE